MERSLAALNRRIVACRACARLVAYREAVARTKRRQYNDWAYWGRPVPGFGDPRARMLVVGLAPAAHGGNRTGRIFTGDRSGDWLYEALFATGFANQPTSTDRDDGLELRDAYVTAIARCAPPGNRPLPEEVLACQPFLRAELRLLRELRVVVALGGIALNGFLAARSASGLPVPSPRPRFGHGLQYRLDDQTTLLMSYHPSQQNTFTGRLTRSMLHGVFLAARALIEGKALAGTAAPGGKHGPTGSARRTMRYRGEPI
jgi:uracil-DNA glycosylase family 4